MIDHTICDDCIHNQVCKYEQNTANIIITCAYKIDTSMVTMVKTESSDKKKDKGN